MVLGTEFVEFEPSIKTDTLYEFEVTGSEPLSFGLTSGFRVEGTFEKYDKTGAKWITMEDADKSKVMVRQNWFDFLIEHFNIFHANKSVNANDIPAHITPYINTWAFAHMNKDTRKLLCPEPVNPGNAVAHGEDWDLASTQWTNYASLIYGKDKVSFRFVPLFQWPFHQAPNYLLETQGPGSVAVPINLLGKLHFRLHMAADTSVIFKQQEAVALNQVKYRFNMTKLVFFAEELRMSQTIGRNFFTSKPVLPYPGVTKHVICENIPAGVYSHRLVIPTVEFPEGAMIFCVNKTVISGRSKYQDLKTDKVFPDHHIKSLDFTFDGLPFYSKRPAVGQLDHYLVKLATFRDLLFSPPFGLILDHDVVSADPADTTAFPILYCNFLQAGKESRIQCVNDTTYAANKIADLVYNFTFDEPTSGENSYIIVAFYSTIHLLLQGGGGGGKNAARGFTAFWNKNKMIN